MKIIWRVALSAALLLMSSGTWAGDMGGNAIGHDQSVGGQPWNAYLHQRELRERQQYDEQYRNLHGAIVAEQNALDRELNRSDPDLAKVKQFHHDLSELRDELGHVENRFDHLKQEESGLYQNAPYSNAS